MMDLEQICLPIRSQLQRVDDEILALSATDLSIINEIMRYVINSGGKRLRPTLTLLSAELAGYKGEKIIKIAAAMEMIHSVSLMHDDVIDNANVRRGKPSANAKWGNQISVLVGDFFWCKASDVFIRLGHDKILQIVGDTITATTKGEILDVTKGNSHSITEEEYLKIIQYKTAVLLSACCHIGAVIADVPEIFETALKDYGYNLGMAFQLSDDVLDYTSDEFESGKLSGIDLREGKITLPLIVALSRCNGNEYRIIKNSILADKVDTDLFNGTLQIIKKYDGLDYARNAVSKYSDKAKDALASFKMSISKESLLSLAEYVVNRCS